MASGGRSESTQRSTEQPGTLSPVTASLWPLFGMGVGNVSGLLQPTPGAGGQALPGGALGPESFAALAGLGANQPLSGMESFLLGEQGGQYGQGGGLPPALLSQLFAGQGLLNAGIAPALETLDPTARINQARRQFSQETLPAILEAAPGFSSSDLQRELFRSGTDLETGIAALREQNLPTSLSAIQGLADAVGSYLSSGAANILNYGQAGRQFITDTSPAGDALRLASDLQSLTGPALVNVGSSYGRSKSGQGGVLS